VFAHDHTDKRKKINITPTVASYAYHNTGIQ